MSPHLYFLISSVTIKSLNIFRIVFHDFCYFYNQMLHLWAVAPSSLLFLIPGFELCCLSLKSVYFCSKKELIYDSFSWPFWGLKLVFVLGGLEKFLPWSVVICFKVWPISCLKRILWYYQVSLIWIRMPVFSPMWPLYSMAAALFGFVKSHTVPSFWCTILQVPSATVSLNSTVCLQDLYPETSLRNHLYVERWVSVGLISYVSFFLFFAFPECHFPLWYVWIFTQNTGEYSSLRTKFPKASLLKKNFTTIISLAIIILFIWFMQLYYHYNLYY